MGRFLPHPDDIPVELTLRKCPPLAPQRLHSISLGGVACNSPRGWRRGAAVTISMPSLGDDACYPGYVAWSHKHAGGYRIGIVFTDEQTLFGARMGEQVCQIEHYRRLQQQQSSQPLDIEALALEWVGHHAVEFSQATLERALVQPALD